jgi:hypothetical protein
MFFGQFDHLFVVFHFDLLLLKKPLQLSQALFKRFISGVLLIV